MKRIHRILLNLFPIYALLTIGCFSSCRTAHIPEKQETAISGNVLIVFYDTETGKSDLLSAAKYYQRVKGVLSVTPDRNLELNETKTPIK